MRQAQLISSVARRPKADGPTWSYPDRRPSRAGAYSGLFPRIVREFDDTEDPLLYRDR